MVLLFGSERLQEGGFRLSPLPDEGTLPDDRIGRGVGNLTGGERQREIFLYPACRPGILSSRLTANASVRIGQRDSIE